MNSVDLDDTYATVDILASDFVARYRNGDRPTVEEYAIRHPDLSEPIRRVFPLVLSVEKVKVDQQSEADGSATLAGRVIQRLGDFRLVREIGRGGMGIVYEAEQESLGRSVAIKVLPKQSLLDDEALRRFQREAKTAAAMHHSNIVPIFGTGQSDGTHYLVMQLVRGESLDKLITSNTNSTLATVARERRTPSPPSGDGSNGTSKNAGPFHCRRAAELASQIADGLAYAHDSGVIHRDVKPANILIDEDGVAQLTDFGVAQNIQDDPTMTQVLSGSPRYMAPERFQGISDERCDVYSAGLTLYEMLAGTPAFQDLSPHQLPEAVKLHLVKPLKDVRPDVPIDLQTIVAKSINPDTADRYQSASELRDDLNRFLNDKPILARRTTTLQTMVRWCRRNPALASAIVIASASLVAATVASSIGFAMTSAANKRSTTALAQSEQTVDLALQSLDGVVDVVAVPDSAFGDMAADGIDGKAFLLNPSPHAAQVLRNIQPLYERLANQSPTRSDIVQQMIEARLRLSQIQQQLGQTESVVKTLSQGIELLRTRGSVAGLPNGERQLLFARLYNELGKAFALELAYEKSDQAFGESIEAGQNVSEPDNRHKLQLALAHVSLGDPPPQRRRQTGVHRDSATARHHLSAAETILSQLTSTKQNAGEIAVLRSRIHLAESHRAKRPMVRQAEFASAIAILRERLEQSPEDFRVRFALVESLASVNLRRQVAPTQSASEARERLGESLVELQPLRLNHPETPLFAVSEVHILHKLSHLARNEGNNEQSLEYLRKAIAIQSTLVDASPESMPHRCWRALLNRSLADVHRRQGDEQKTQEAIAAAVLDLDAISEDSKSHPFAVQTQQIIEDLQTQEYSGESRKRK